MKITKELKKKKEEKEEELLKLDNVVSVGIGNKRVNDEDQDELAIVVGVTEKKDEEEIESSQKVPRKVGSFQTDVIEIGQPRAPPCNKEGIKDKVINFFSKIAPFVDKDNKCRFRPIPVGVSIGHHMVSAGTSSLILIDDDGNEYPASNNHVLARSNKASKGDVIVQPGTHDGGKRSEDKVGELKDYIKIKDNCKVDLAWLDKTKGFSNEIYGIEGNIYEPKEAEVNDKVIKSGRTTGVTEGKVLQKHSSVNVRYSDGSYTLKDQIVCSDLSKGGDSGSAVFKKDGGKLHPVGLLFAGSEKSTILNDIKNITEKSGMEVKTEKNEDYSDEDKECTFFMTFFWRMIN